MFLHLYLIIAFIICTCRYRGRSRSDRYARRKCSESYAECEGNRPCRGMCQHKDSYCLRYEAALGASSALVSILISSCTWRNLQSWGECARFQLVFIYTSSNFSTIYKKKKSLTYIFLYSINYKKNIH